LGAGVRAATQTGLAVALIAVVSGVLAALAGSAPTGAPGIDMVLTGVTVGAITWLGAAALRWDAALISLIAAATSWTLAGAAIALATAVVGFTQPVAANQRNIVTGGMIAIALNVAIRSQLGGFLGLSAIVFLALAAYVGIIGARRRTPAVRRATLVVCGSIGALSMVGTASLGVAGLLAADDLRAADTHVRTGLAALGDGDVDGARAAFGDAATRFAGAGDHTAFPLVDLTRLIPGVAQHRRIATDLTAAGTGATAELAAHLAEVDLDALSTDNGRIDVQAVRNLEPPLLAVDTEIRSLQRTIATLDSPWLLPPVAARLDDLAAEVADQRRRSDDALTVTRAAPGLLGGDGARTYFIGFTTPAEARGIGGFMGNWAEITVTDGRIEMTRFGRADDLNDAGDPATRRFTATSTSSDDDPGLQEWLARYGDYHLDSGPGGTTGPAVWKNINMSPDMTTTGRAIADLYPQSGGRDLDGVFIIDVYTLARLLTFTGPIPLPDGQIIDGRRTVTVDNAADFLLNDQYDVVRTAERVDILEEFSRSVIDRFLGAPLPPPTDLLDTLGPMVDQGRFTGWAARDTEQDLFTQLGLAGTLPALDRTGAGAAGSGDRLAVTFNNAAGNKIDYFLATEGTYRVTADAATSTATAEFALTLTNNAPARGEPPYVIGNVIGLPDGTNRTWVSVFSRLPVTDVRLGDQPVAIEVGTEAGHFVTSAFITLGSGESATLTLTMAGPLDVARGYELSMRTPPTVGPTPVSVEATWISADGVAHRTSEDRRDPGLARIRISADG
jgi:hypothetical protein